MTQILLEGVVGWDVRASDIRSALAAANGDDIDLVVSSPGGSAYEALAIFNAIRDYRRSGGKVDARVVGLAASAATYIPMAADSVTVEDNAVWMIHNPYGLVAGNQNDMAKMATVLNGLAGILANAYAAKTGKDTDEIREMMDAETYLYGGQIVAFGFADEIVPAGDGAESEAEAMAMAALAIGDMTKKLKDEPERQKMEEIAALLPEIVVSHKPVVDREPAKAEITEPATKAGQKREVPRMTLEQLKQEHPAIYNEAFDLGIQAGVQQERGRVLALREQISADPDNAKLSEVVNEAVSNGKTVADVQTAINVAIRDGKNLDGENAPMVHTEGNVAPLSAEDKEAARLMGISEAEYRKYNGGDK